MFISFTFRATCLTACAIAVGQAAVDEQIFSASRRARFRTAPSPAMRSRSIRSGFRRSGSERFCTDMQAWTHEWWRPAVTLSRSGGGAMPQTGQGPGISQPQCTRLSQARFHPPHAAKVMQSM